jgi:hypothetical protein
VLLNGLQALDRCDCCGARGSQVGEEEAPLRLQEAVAVAVAVGAKVSLVVLLEAVAVAVREACCSCGPEFSSKDRGKVKS